MHAVFLSSICDPCGCVILVAYPLERFGFTAVGTHSNWLHRAVLAEMWRALCVVIVVLTQRVGGRRSRAPDATSIPYVQSLSGGASSPSNKSTSVVVPRTTRRTAWSLPWRTRRRRGRRKAAVENGRGTASIPHANAAASKMSSVAGAGLNSCSVASFIGAFLLGGGALSVSPQVVGASPFDPRPPPKSSRHPFFEGWFIRWAGM